MGTVLYQSLRIRWNKLAADFALGVENLLVAITVVSFPCLHGKLTVGNGFAAELAPEAMGMPILS
jgi:hypothetical protein